MTREALLLVGDILESIDLIESYTRGMDQEAFESDRQVQDAVIRRFEIIGEAVKSLPEDLKKTEPHVRWSDIAGLRDVMIHGYHRVNMRRVWHVIEDDLENLAHAVGDMAKLLERN